MIDAILIIAAVVIGLSVFWSDCVNFLKDTIEQVKKTVEGILFGTKVFIQKIGEMAQEIAKHYTKKGDVWKETTYTREVPASEVPQDIREKAKQAERINEAVDITQRLELELKGA